MLDLTVCPEPGCICPAQIFDRSVLRSTDGPVEHVRVRCLNHHFFLLPVGKLTSRRLAEVPEVAADAFPSASAD